MAIIGATIGRVCATALNLFAAAALAGCATLRPQPADPVAVEAAEQRPEVQAARQRWEAAARRAQEVQRAAERAPATAQPRPAQPALRAFGLDNLVRSGSDIGQAALAYPPSVRWERRPSPEARAARAELRAAAADYDRLRRSAYRETSMRTPAPARLASPHRQSTAARGSRR